MTDILSVLLAYLLGGIPFGYLLVRLKTGDDVRSLGSGNIGATNVLRTAGRTIGVLTLILDIGKGYFAVWLAAVLSGHSPLWESAAALAVMLGHAFPPFLKFKGGKAVAAFVGAFLYIAPLPLLATMVVFVVVVSATGFLSLGSVLGAICFPLGAFLIDHPPAPIWSAAVLACLFILWKHKANIERLRAGTENVLSLKGKKR